MERSGDFTDRQLCGMMKPVRDCPESYRRRERNQYEM